MKAIELLKDIRAYAKEFKYTLKPKQKFEPDMIIEGCNQALAELAERPEPTSDAVKILCKRYGTSLAKIALDLEAENKRLKKLLGRAACRIGVNDLLFLEIAKALKEQKNEQLHS